jgi:uncharacterized protein (DUF4415 family)
MQKSGTIVRYTAEEIEERRRRGEWKTDVERVKALTEEELEASIDFEEEGLPIWDTMVIGNRQPKQQLTIRFDQDVIDWFKSEGAGYQTRMNEVLRAYVDAMKRKARAEAKARR